MLRSHLQSSGVRRGNILIVTLLLLALFATIGLTIVYYTKDLAEQQRINIEAASNGALFFTDDGSVAFDTFLSTLIYDWPNPANGTTPTNNIWGHSLLRTMYGGVGTAAPYPLTGTFAATVPWNGVGSFHENTGLNGLDRASVVNLAAAGGSLLPEIATTGVNKGAFIPKNAPYTYPDLKDFYLGSFVPATGEVLTPSFYRSYVFRDANQPATATGLEPNNPNWKNAKGKYLTVRPRPADQSQAFPLVPPNADGTYTGDVQNLSGSYYYYPPTAKSQFAGQFVAHNDSIWVDIGLPPMTLLNGKTVKPLVAPLILDLDSLLNYNVHGNQWGATGSGAGMGTWEVNLLRALPTDGASLVNARGMPATKSGLTTRAFNSQLASLSLQLPQGSSVPWTPGGGATPPSASYTTGSMVVPGQNNSNYYNSIPTYNPAYVAGSPGTAGYDSKDQLVQNHPALYNPTEATVYPTSDLQQLMAAYCSTPYTYTSTTASPPGLLNLGGVPAPTIRGNPGSAGYPGNPTNTFPFPYPSLPYFPPQQPTASTPSNYRLDPANLNRGLLTPYSWSLDMPGLSPNFMINQTRALTLVTGGNNAQLNGPTLTNPTIGNAFPSPGNYNANDLSDFPGKTQAFNAKTALGPIDLNRALADYRNDTTTAPSPKNMASYSVAFPAGGTTLTQQAAIDRQQFAMSIFIRLVAASGANASYTTIAGIGETIQIPANLATTSPNEFNALRALAQIAANIVDYIDSDDISTAFVWNPLNVKDPLNQNNFSTQNLANNVVFGVEKPRLVLNEGYSEIINDPTDNALKNPGSKNPVPGSKNPYVRFWLELQNPTNTPYASGTGPLGDGSVRVYYTKAENTITNAPYNPYEIQIVRSQPGGGVNVSSSLRVPANSANNVAGAIVGVAPDLTFDFSPAGTLAVSPANGTPSSTTGSILVLAPSSTTSAPATDGWNPTAATLGGNVVTAKPPTANSTNSLTYNTLTLASALPANGRLADGLNHQVVLLRRLANPYLPPNDPSMGAVNAALPINPYVTVDYLDYLPATDQILYSSTSATKRTAGGANGLPQNPASIGRVQPYAGWTDPTAGLQRQTTGTYNFVFPRSLVLPQAPTKPTTTVQHTFGQVNSVTPASPPSTQTYTPGSGKLVASGNPETIMTQHDWLTHLDRTLINQTELLHVSTGKPHELTLRFAVPNALGAAATDIQTNPRFGYTLAEQMGLNPSNLATTPTNTLYRALEVLRIQPYGQMTSLGGRVPGKINVNTVQDKRVWDSLFDAQSWNVFTQNDVTTMWKSMIGSRTTSLSQASNQRYSPSGAALTDTTGTATYITPAPGETVYDTNAATGTFDRPFLPFGAPAVGQGTLAYTTGSGMLTDTLVRSGSIFTAANVGTSPNPYQQVEALRKIANSTTTVSHTFAVWATVGYFDYNLTSPGGTATLGAEYYSVVPGDLRRKYFAVVDRSLVGLDPNTKLQSQNLPFFTTLDVAAVSPGSNTIVITTSNDPVGPTKKNPTTPNAIVYSSGVPVNVMSQTPTGTSWIAIGTGATREVVQVTGVSQYPAATAAKPNPTAQSGVAQLTLSAALQYPHWPGEMVSNIIPGNPGPQTSTFNYTQTPYSYIVPYSARLQ